MKIAILTLPLHHNIGGILQAFALQKVLKDQGHEVKVLQKIEAHSMSIYRIPVVYSKRLLIKLFKDRKFPFFYEKKILKDQKLIQRETKKFIDKNISLHEIRHLSNLRSGDFDAYIVGSDQIWRKQYFNSLWHSPIYEAFLSFTEGWNVRRMSYAASFGVDDLSGYTDEDVNRCKQSISAFEKITVREKSAIEICKYAFDKDAQLVLDPTMLLKKEDYIAIGNEAGIKKSPGSLLCYILDPTYEKLTVISTIANNQGLIPFSVSADVENKSLPMSERIQTPVEVWLRGFMDAEFIVTDSFHACVFSILFNKPFIVYGNIGRGMDRFYSLLDFFGLRDRLIYNPESPLPEKEIEWNKVNDKLNVYREICLGIICDMMPEL